MQTLLHHVQEWNLISIDQRRLSFFKYEKRIREMSPPEKVFEYFASVGNAREGFSMTASDMMRSVVPVYPPKGSNIIRAGCLPGEPLPHVPQHESVFFEKFDVDGDGVISFEEWTLFEALLSIPSDDVEVAFRLMDIDGDKTVDRAEFEELLSALQTRFARHHSPGLRRSRQDLKACPHGLVECFFGKKNKSPLTLQEFSKFVQDLRHEMARLEFDYYDYSKSGAIAGDDFAHSVIGCARLKHVDDYLQRVETLPPHLRNCRISYSDFLGFRSVWRRIRTLSVALDFGKSTCMRLSPRDFQRLVERVLDIKLSMDIVNILYHLFPGDNAGELNSEYLTQVMDRHFETGRQLPFEKGSVADGGFYNCLAKCTKRR